MNSTLSGIPIPRRRRLAATLGLFAVLFTAVGAVAATGGDTPAAVRAFSAVALVIAAALGLIGWGVLHSVKIDLAETRLDAVIEDALAARGGQDISCGCGHDHDPDELHVTDADDACAHDGRGAECTHNCESCVLAALRPSPTAPRASS